MFDMNAVHPDAKPSLDDPETNPAIAVACPFCKVVAGELCTRVRRKKSFAEECARARRGDVYVTGYYDAAYAHRARIKVLEARNG